MKFQQTRYVLIGGIISVVLLGALIFRNNTSTEVLQTASAKEVSLLSRGTVAPDFRLHGAHGKSFSIDSLKGNKAFLIFLTPNCLYCKKLKEAVMSGRVLDSANHLVLITSYYENTPYGGAPSDSAKLQLQEPTTESRYPVLRDADGSVAQAYRVQSLPTVYLLDENSRVIESGVGLSESLELVQKLVDIAMVVQEEDCSTCQ